MHAVREFFGIIAEIIDLIGILILIFGFLKILVKYLYVEFLHHPLRTPITYLQRVRCDIGIYTLLALDFLIASDIINTIAEISQKQLIELSVMIVLRTGIGYFIGKEVEEIHNIDTTA